MIETDQYWRIVGFEEKPAKPKASRVHPGKVNASMGVYLFNTQLLVPILIADAEDPTSSHDFGKDILPRIIDKYRVFAYNFLDENKKETSYWRDVGTIDAYHEANMDLVSVSPIFNFTIRAGRCIPGSSNILRRNSCLPIRTHGRGAGFDRFGRIDYFRRAGGAIGAGLRRAREQL